MHDRDSTPADRAVALATQFLSRVWGPAHDLDAIDELMNEDYKIWSGGKLVTGRSAFKVRLIFSEQPTRQPSTALLLP